MGNYDGLAMPAYGAFARYRDNAAQTQIWTVTDTGATLIGNALSSSTGYGVPLSSSQTYGLRVVCDDNDAALGAGTYRAIHGRMLMTGTSTADISVFGVQGQVKLLDTYPSPGWPAGVWGYFEMSSGTLANAGAGLRGTIDVPSGSTVNAGAVAAALQLDSTDLGGTITGLAVAINVPNPVSGTWSALARIADSSGCVTTAAVGGSNTKKLKVYIDTTAFFIPLYTA